MALSSGDRLGPYEILGPIGAGGMGEVYKARDTRLDRTVAVKVLPEHIAKREDLRARAVASLNHPHICTLHDIGNQDGARYMVTEFMEGETLAARIEKGAIALDQALKFATRIADARHPLQPDSHTATTGVVEANDAPRMGRIAGRRSGTWGHGLGVNATTL